MFYKYRFYIQRKDSLFSCKKFILQLCANEERVWERVMLQSWLMFVFGVLCTVLQVGPCFSKGLLLGLIVLPVCLCRANEYSKI